MVAAGLSFNLAYHRVHPPSTASAAAPAFAHERPHFTPEKRSLGLWLRRSLQNLAKRRESTGEAGPRRPSPCDSAATSRMIGDSILRRNSASVALEPSLRHNKIVKVSQMREAGVRLRVVDCAAVRRGTHEKESRARRFGRESFPVLCRRRFHGNAGRRRRRQRQQRAEAQQGVE
jgi:hypothetical protein